MIEIGKGEKATEIIVLLEERNNLRNQQDVTNSSANTSST